LATTFVFSTTRARERERKKITLRSRFEKSPFFSSLPAKPFSLPNQNPIENDAQRSGASQKKVAKRSTHFFPEWEASNFFFFFV
jgi:hypothetical protein